MWDTALTMLLNPLAIGFLLGLVSTVLWVFLAHGLSKKFRSARIAEIRKVAEQYAQGEWERPLFPEAKGELKTLILALNQMGSVLKTRITEAEDEKAKLSAILDHMAEGVIAVDSGKEVLMANPSARKMFALPHAAVLGKSLLEVVRNQKIDDMMARAIQGRTLIAEEIEFSQPERKYLKVNAVGLPPSEGVCGILVFYDVTEIRRLENVRREFVANVSHELRTPLTSIKGFIETLLEGAFQDPDRSRTFLKMMEEDAGRLTRLIDELLELSKIESREMAFHFEPLSLEEEVEAVIRIFRLRAQEKGIEIENRISPSQIPPVWADRDKLKQVLVNLLDNAIKFNKTGGRIVVSTESLDEEVRVSIEDTGIGIPKEAVPRIFERFFRVDKARSKGGGTGLGLAIVKHIIEAQGGKVFCESELGKGSKFSFTLHSSKQHSPSRLSYS
jgi:two-component system phosphate regulon sensor histidine kinase PhoR